MTTSPRTPILRYALLLVLNVFAVGLLSVQVAAAAPEDPEPRLQSDAPLMEAPRPGTLFGDVSVVSSETARPILTVPEGNPLLRTSMLAVDGIGPTTDWFQTSGVSLAPEGRQAPSQRPTLTGQYGTDGVILVSVGF